MENEQLLRNNNKNMKKWSKNAMNTGDEELTMQLMMNEIDENKGKNENDSMNHLHNGLSKKLNKKTEFF